jgi:hypothetical protein
VDGQRGASLVDVCTSGLPYAVICPAGFFLYRPRQFHSLTFWITFLANMGALGLLIGGICHWEKQEIMDHSGMWAVQLYRGLAYLFFGSFLLDASAFLTLVEISNPEL